MIEKIGRGGKRMKLNFGYRNLRRYGLPVGRIANPADNFLDQNRLATCLNVLASMHDLGLVIGRYRNLNCNIYCAIYCAIYLCSDETLVIGFSD